MRKSGPRVAYLAGPITGNPDYKLEFARVKNRLQQYGYTVLNPALLPAGLTQADYMRITGAMLEAADVVFMLPGWLTSGGAKIEYELAKYTGKDIDHVSRMEWLHEWQPDDYTNQFKEATTE